MDTNEAKPKLLDQLRTRIRARNYNLRTEQAYVFWVRRYIFFHGKRHPNDLGPAEIQAFLNHLATDKNVAASTQNQALAALLFLYREVLKHDLGDVDDFTRAKRSETGAHGAHGRRSTALARPARRRAVAHGLAALRRGAPPD